MGSSWIFERACELTVLSGEDFQTPLVRIRSKSTIFVLFMLISRCPVITVRILYSIFTQTLML